MSLIPLWLALPAMIAMSALGGWFSPADPFLDGRLQWVRAMDPKLRIEGYVCREVAWDRRGRLTRVVWDAPPGIRQVEAEW